MSDLKEKNSKICFQQLKDFCDSIDVEKEHPELKDKKKNAFKAMNQLAENLNVSFLSGDECSKLFGPSCEHPPCMECDASQR